MATEFPNIWPCANDEIVVAVQVETAEGLANVDAIAATDGVDMVFVGPGDLSVSIDAIGPAIRRRLSKAIETIIAASLAHDKVAGIFCATPEAAGKWAAKGASFFILASDTMFLGAGHTRRMRRGAQTSRSQRSRRTGRTG